MKRTLMCATAAAALASAMSVANAQDGWYGRADLGYSFDGELDSDPPTNAPFALGGDQELDGDGLLGAQIGLGYGFGNGFRLESTFGYRGGDLEPSTTITGASILNLPPLANGGYSVGGDGNISIYELMFNALYDFNPTGAVQPYLGAGIGLAKVDARATNLRAGVVTAGGVQTFDANGFNDDDTGMAYQLLGGIGYGLTERLTLD
ncbi:MAG: outer membrane beta-barrel protein, partial [Henriciella sp.]|nr:outer membrane beta-barrel protein [Henriciella sp.]